MHAHVAMLFCYLYHYDMAKRCPIFTSGRKAQASVAGTWKPLHEFLLSPLLSIYSPSIIYFPTWADFSLMTLNLCISKTFMLWTALYRCWLHWVCNATSFAKRSYNFKWKKIMTLMLSEPLSIVHIFSALLSFN